MIKELHDGLDSIIQQYQKFKKCNPWISAVIFNEFKMALEDHMAWEEKNLFPFFEEETGLAEASPTQMMRKEHNQIRLLLQEMKELLNQPKNRTEMLEENLVEKRLMEMFHSHEEKEEELFLPWFETVLWDKKEKERLTAPAMS